MSKLLALNLLAVIIPCFATEIFSQKGRPSIGYVCYKLLFTYVYFRKKQVWTNKIYRFYPTRNIRKVMNLHNFKAFVALCKIHLFLISPNPLISTSSFEMLSVAILCVSNSQSTVSSSSALAFWSISDLMYKHPFCFHFP